MDNPVQDCHQVIHNLTQGDSATQQETLEKYFTYDASFTHPFCSVKNNRHAILRIFQWYKILSPHIELEVQSVAFDEQKLLLYVTIHQVFAIWFIPFHRSPVTLTTVLQLMLGQNLNTDPRTRITTPTRRYYISSQNDLYQVDQFVRFFAPLGLGTTVIAIWHWFATLFCIFGAWLLQPWQWVFLEISRPLKYRSSPDFSPKTRRKFQEDRKNLDDYLNGVNENVKVTLRRAGRKSEIDEDVERESLMNS